MNWELEKENLEKAILQDKISYEELGKRYNCSGANIKKQAKKLGIELPQRRKINESEHFNKGTGKVVIKDVIKYVNKETIKKYCLSCGKELHFSRNNQKFCDSKCQNDYAYKQYVERWKRGEETGMKGSYSVSSYIKRYLFEKFNNKCCKCGWGEINSYTGNIPLEIEHKDGNYTNNSKDNLELLCPNCHSLTSTYKGANRGKGRTTRSKYYIGGSYYINKE